MTAQVADFLYLKSKQKILMVITSKILEFKYVEKLNIWFLFNEINIIDAPGPCHRDKVLFEVADPRTPS